MSQFRLVSYNICKGVGLDFKRRPERSLEIINALGGDIVVLQEADYRFKGRQALFSPELIYQKTGLQVIDLATDLPGLGWHGNVILSKTEFEVRQTHLIDLPGFEPRGTIMTDIELFGERLIIGAMHLGLRTADRRVQVETVVDYFKDHINDSCIFTGDLNVWRKMGKALAELHIHFEMAHCGRSFPSLLPIAPLDRIFYTDQKLQLLDSGVYRQGKARHASDHLPIYADFMFV